MKLALAYIAVFLATLIFATIEAPTVSMTRGIEHEEREYFEMLPEGENKCNILLFHLKYARRKR